jgi:hypothetical protein
MSIPGEGTRQIDGEGVELNMHTLSTIGIVEQLGKNVVVWRILMKGVKYENRMTPEAARQMAQALLTCADKVEQYPTGDFPESDESERHHAEFRDSLP